ncbi:hypothetical protein JA1_003272 [Spathaspora sp. JA1]|nr:hypothetical protein JA1_003272 [Spathaspora sp. JA1]
MTYTGSCLCGEVTFKLNGEPSRTMTCYCTDCRKGAGALGQFITVYDTKNVEINDPNSKIGEYIVQKTKSGLPKKKQFCTGCGCTLRTLPGKYNGEVSMIRQALLDDDFSKHVPQASIFNEEKERFTTGIKSEFY